MSAELSPELVGLLHRDWTLEDLDDLPDDGYRYEIMDGQLIVTPPPTPLHQDVIDHIRDVIAPQVRGRFRVTTGTGLRTPALGPERYVVPDLMVVTGPRPVMYYEPSAVQVVMEVISPSTRLRDRGDKRELYAEHGIGSYWLVDPEASVMTGLTLQAGVYVEAWKMTVRDPGDGLLAGVTFADLLAE